MTCSNDSGRPPSTVTPALGAWRSAALLCAAFLVATARPAQAGINVWTSHGPGVVGVSVLAIDPITPSTLYAGTPFEGVFKSTDGASSWQAANTGLVDNRPVTALAIDPTTPSTLYAATDSGVFKSTDAARLGARLTQG